MPRRPDPVPAPLARAAMRFDAFRKARTQRQIPADLWQLAVGLAARHGLSRTARALGVGYASLKERLEAEPARNQRRAAPVGPAFLEVLPGLPTSECVVELEASCGTKLRVQLKGADTPDLLALGRLLLERSR